VCTCARAKINAEGVGRDVTCLCASEFDLLLLSALSVGDPSICIHILHKHIYLSTDYTNAATPTVVEAQGEKESEEDRATKSEKIAKADRETQIDVHKRKHRARHSHRTQTQTHKEPQK